jgi:hypothetical protein
MSVSNYCTTAIASGELSAEGFARPLIVSWMRLTPR